MHTALYLFSLINMYLSLIIFYNLNLNFNDCILFCHTDALQFTKAVPNNIKVVLNFSPLDITQV